ncbi:O-antigen ligase family protein [Flavobacterium cerinum]|uniref:O-antigen ligase family protein n=1 Tax=Flavobacterium cerinum TaxID=2502784 RepID=A0ABY5IX98_9FLAO|nr:O-antigen ligase family protein [Flavobacterium cerinum]UUC47051.1 O-antigen ligase family protein [Flavobacterium cerinum]
MGTNKQITYITLLLLHMAIGGVIYVLPFLAKLLTVLIFIIGLIVLLKTRNKNNEALYLSAYVVGIEVFLRMTDGMIFNEFGKYAVMLFLLIGMFYRGFSKNAWPYWIFIILLVPGIILSTVTLSYETNLRKAIVFNISGPVCLGVAAIYCFGRKITMKQMLGLLTAFAMPVVTMVTYLFFYTPSIRDVVTGTQSNFETSGGFGPNQVSTILGLGTFLFFSQFLLNSPTKRIQLINIALTLITAYRGIITFSRGGMITGCIMILLLVLLVYFRLSKAGKSKMLVVLIFTVLASLSVWIYSSYQTSGMIDKRYANQDALGREKESKLSGREELIKTEIQMFMDHPFLGIGVGKNKEYREELTGIQLATHNEITRMLAEHGMLGVINLLILFIVPLLLSLDNKYHFFLFCFFAFWLLTINHAAMRLAAPAFVYALSLLKVYPDEEENSLYRE